jgi:hypothetical protein
VLSLAPKFLNKICLERGWDEEQLFLNDFPQIQNGFGVKIQRTPMSWISIENLLKILGTLDFNEIWSASPLLHLIARKNKFSSKEDQKVEFHSKWEIQLISR